MTTAGELHRHWRQLPAGKLDDIIGQGCCLILAPHPDDESLGCGGLIAACCAAARPPLVVILTDGSGSHPRSWLYPPQRLAAVREAEVTRAAAILGLEKERLLFLRQPDTQAPHAGPVFDAMVELLVNYVAAFGCSALLAPWRGDPHGDHLAASLLGMTAAQAAGVRAVAYPVWGWTLPDAAPVADATMAGWRLDVTQHLATKRRAIAAHASQHGRLIADDTSGFHLPRGLLAAFDTPWETFLLP